MSKETYMSKETTLTENEEEMKALIMIMCGWVKRELYSHPTYESYTNSTLISNESFIAMVLLKRMKAFEIEVKIPDELILILEISTEGNPGKSLTLLYEILSRIPNLQKGHMLTCDDYIRLTGTGQFKTVWNKEDDKWMEDLWDSQKTDDGCNKVDYPEYWRELFKS